MEKTVYESNVPRVYTLYRVSTIGQVEKDDIPMQKQVCRDFAKKQGWVVVKEFSEKGISGYKVSAKDRDAIQEIQHDAALGKFDILLVFMFDRLGRRDDETPFIVEWFVKNGVEVWSAMEGQQRFDNHVDKLMNYIRYWQASGESLKTSIRTKTRLGQLTEEGHYTGGTVPYGYRAVDKGRVNKRNRTVLDLQIDEDEAEVIRLIFHKYVDEGYCILCHAIDVAIDHQPNMPKMHLICNEVRKRTGKRTNEAVSRALNRAAKDIWQNGRRRELRAYWIEDPPTAKELISLISAKLWADRNG